MAAGFLKIAAPLKYPQVERLPEKEREQLLNGITAEYNMLWDKMKMNLMPPTHSVYPLLALVNHSCLPNAELSGGRLTAVKRIEAGEPIVASYTPKNIPTELKFHWLQKNMRFDCRCDYCEYKLADERGMEVAKMEEVGLENLKQVQAERDQYNDPNRLVTSSGRFTRAAEEYFDSLLEEKLKKYPREFREGLLRVQETAMGLVAEKGLEPAIHEIRQRRQRLQTLVASGVTPQEQAQAEDAAMSEVLQSLVVASKKNSEEH